jgi:3-dehydroquinate dehydratase-2
MKAILVINGPNLNLLGTREPAVYGAETLADVESRVRRRAAEIGCQVEFRQSNLEGEIVGWLQEAPARFHAVVLNPAALGHYSFAIQDAITGARVRVVEVHISNVHAREEWRHRLVIAPVAAGVIMGLGTIGYELALEAAARLPD